MKNNIKTILIIFAFFILALGLRINMFGSPDFFEPDQAWETRISWDILTVGHVQNPDPLAYYQLGGAPQTVTNPLFVLNAGIYNILFSWNIGINKDIFITLMQLLPAIFGALICLVLFFVGKATSNGRDIVGLIVMFVAAVMPAFAYRTWSGAQISNSFGFLPFSLGILLMLWAFNESNKNKKIIFAILSGACFFAMVFMWSMYLIVPLILVAFWVYYSIFSLTKDKNKESDMVDLIVFLLIFGLFNLGTFIAGINWLNVAASFMVIPTIALSIISGIVIIGGSLLIYFRPQLSEDHKNMIFSLIGIGLILAVLGIAYFTTLNIVTVDKTSTGSLVGEEQPGIGFFTQKYNIYSILIPLGFISAIVLFWWKGRNYQFVPLFLAAFTLFFIMAFTKLKFTFSLGYGIILITIVIAILFYELWLILKEKNKTELRIIFIPVILFLIIGLSACSIFLQDYSSSFTSDPALKNVTDYLRTQTSVGSKVLNTWNYGHILSFFGERAVSSDNRNYSVLANAQFAIFENDSNAQKAYNLVREMGADYIIVQVNDFYSMQSNEFYINNKVDAALGTKFREPIINIVGCSSDGNIAVCPGVGQLEVDKFSKWTSIPVSFYGGQYPIYLYIIGQNAVILNPAANETNLIKVLLQTDETKLLYEKVFESGSYIILKVIK